MLGPGDEVKFKEDGKWKRGTIREVAPKIEGYPRKFVVRVPGPGGTFRHPLVEVENCRPANGWPSRKFNEGDSVRYGEHAGEVVGVLLIMPDHFEAKVEFTKPYPPDYGSWGWVPFDKLEHVGSEPAADQRETLLLATAEMHAEESRPKEPRCEAWRAEIVLGAADWESEIPSRGVTFLTTPEGHLQVDATDADEAVGSITFARPHCREAVVVMLNARLRAKRLDDAAGIVTPEEKVQP